MELIALFLLLLVLLAIVLLVIKYPGPFLALVVTVLLLVSCERSDAALRFEISTIADSVEDRAAVDEAVHHAARIFEHQFGIELAATFNDTSDVAQHTHAPTLLDAVKFYRFERTEHRAADATVLLTRRTLTRGYQGIATIGPACSASAAAVVVLRSDGYDGQILAHELLHTLGVPHDEAGGWLMSESASRAGSDFASDDTRLTVKAAPLAECMTKPAASSSTYVPVGTPSGGGGSFDWFFVVSLVLLVIIAYMDRIGRQAITRLRNENARLHTMLEQHAAPEFSLRDISDVWERPANDRERMVLVKFHTYAGMQDFAKWLRKEAKRAKAVANITGVEQ